MIIDFEYPGNSDPEREPDETASPPDCHTYGVAVRLPSFRPFAAVIIEYIFRSH